VHKEVVAEIRARRLDGSHDERSDPERKKRKNDLPEFNAKVSLDAMRVKMTLTKLSKNYGVHPT